MVNLDVRITKRVIRSAVRALWLGFTPRRIASSRAAVMMVCFVRA